MHRISLNVLLNFGLFLCKLLLLFTSSRNIIIWNIKALYLTGFAPMWYLVSAYSCGGGSFICSIAKYYNMEYKIILSHRIYTDVVLFGLFLWGDGSFDLLHLYLLHQQTILFLSGVPFSNATAFSNVVRLIASSASSVKKP